MPYATEQDMVDRFGQDELIQLTDRDGSAGAIVTSVLDLALSDADDEIDSYVRKRYELPLASVPPVLTRIACDIARYRLYDDAATDQVTKRYNDTVALLTKISTGVVSLGMDTPPTSANGLVSVTGSPRVMGRNKGSVF